MTKPASTARETGEVVEFLEAQMPGIKDATPTPETRKRKSVCRLLAIPTTANIRAGKNNRPIADTHINTTENSIVFFNIGYAPVLNDFIRIDFTGNQPAHYIPIERIGS